MRRLLLLPTFASLLTLSSVLPASAQEDDPRVFLGTASQIRGAVRVRGCVPDSSAINLRAMPMRVATTREDAVGLGLPVGD